MSPPQGRPRSPRPRALKPERVQAPPRALAAVPDFDDNRLPADRHGSDNDDSAVVLPQRLARYRVALVLEEHTALPTLGLGRPAQIAAFFWQQLQDSPQEVMLAAYIDVRHQLIGWQRAFSGTLSRTAVEPRLILQAALLLNAAGVVIGHNHPSGEPAPSREDIAFTRVMDRAGEVVGVKLVDHLVIGNEGRWVSLRERGGW